MTAALLQKRRRENNKSVELNLPTTNKHNTDSNIIDLFLI